MVRNRAVARLALASICLPLASSAATNRAESALTAPTFYIAAAAKYSGDPGSLVLRGDSNLPAGAVLAIVVYTKFWEGGQLLVENATAAVGADGFFELTLRPAKGKRFQHNMACDIGFHPGDPHLQPPSVLRLVGLHGEKLGFPQNPQAEVGSGENYYLRDIIYVP